MNEQPEALSHAEWLEKSLTIGAKEAAAELRRLHEFEVGYGRMMTAAEAHIAALETALRQAVEALEQIAAYRPLTFAECSDAEAVMGIAERAIPALRERLEQPEPMKHGGRPMTLRECMEAEEPAQQEQEPVALETVYETIIHWDEGGGKRSRRELARRIVALYTSQQPECQYAKDVAMPEYRCVGKCQYAQHKAVEPKCGAIIEVFGKGWRLDYMSLPVGEHKLYTQQYNYTAPQRREWVGLTEEERESFWKADQMTGKEWKELFDAVEAKLREKNA